MILYVLSVLTWNIDCDWGHIIFPVWGFFWIFFSYIGQIGQRGSWRCFFCQPLHLFLHLICGGFKSVVFTQQCHGCAPPECSIACKAPCSGLHRFGSSKASDRRTRDRSLSFLNASVNVDITTYWVQRCLGNFTDEPVQDFNKWTSNQTVGPIWTARRIDVSEIEFRSGWEARFAGLWLIRRWGHKAGTGPNRNRQAAWWSM